MNRGVNHERIFFADDDRTEFGRCLAEIHEIYGAETLAYCLMTNHYHLILRTPDDTLSEAMQHLGGVFTRRTNDRIGRDGPLFRGRFTSIPVTTDAYLHWLVRYVHLNPLDVAGVTEPDRYRWSSLRTYLGLRPPPSFLNRDLVLSAWDDIEAFRRFHEPNRRHQLDVGTADELDALIAHAIVAGDTAGSGFDEDEAPLRPQALAAAVRALVGDAAPSARVAELVAGSFPTGGARRTALYRARLRAERDERVRRAVTWVIDSIAATPRSGVTECA